jgi:hypothetical protein
MGKKNLKQALPGTWYRASEEETDTEKVYRPASSEEEIPKGRGRDLFTLLPDGSLIEGAIAPTDALRETKGTWKLEGDQLAFYTEAASEPSRVMKITSVDKDRLVVKK